MHRDVILYANSQFASFVGVDRVDLIDRRLVGSGRARIRRAGRREPAPPSRRRARRRALRGGDGRPAGPGEPARTNYRADRLRRRAGAAGDRRGSDPHEEAARARQRQDRREGSRRARRAGGAAAAAATTAAAAAAGVRHAVARRGHRHHRHRRAPRVPEPGRREVAGRRRVRRPSAGCSRMSSAWSTRTIASSCPIRSRKRSAAATAVRTI